MDSLASNDEQAVAGVPEDRDPNLEEDGEDLVVANRRNFFQEAPEVREALAQIVKPDLPIRTCREACERIGTIWSQYQEQPGLLDPFLEEMIEPIIGAVAAAVRQKPRNAIEALPNLHLLSSLLYLLTAVRGFKTVSRFFPHEAADLEPCLEAAEEEAKSSVAHPDTWSTLYILTLWLGMVLLTPFDLRSIDSGGVKGLSARILELGQGGLRSTSRTRDACAWMLAKFFTRPDVTLERGLQTFLVWTREAWVTGGDSSNVGTPPSFAVLAFSRCGTLQAWNQTLKAAPRSVLRVVWKEVVELALRGPTGAGAKDFATSSQLRKLRVAVACRAALVALPPRLAPWRYQRGARSLLLNFAQSSALSQGISSDGPVSGLSSKASAAAPVVVEEEEEDCDDESQEQVEEVVELLLGALSDADTIVRWAAAKGVGRVTMRLSQDFGDQVLESLLERCFSFREGDKAWHGGCLAMAELTRRGLLLPERLETVVPLVCQALHFEQVSGNHAVGQHVRDAACYVCWAFARAYAPEILQPFVAEIAKALIQVAVFDREVNCRRAAAAAVQEHVGRQGTFPNGIDVVTIADYWTLSSRRHAYLEVAPSIAALGDGVYRIALIDHLVNRKLQHQDLHVRVLAAQGLARLVEDATEATCTHINSVVLPDLLRRAQQSAPAAGSTEATGSVQGRHGAVAGIAAVTSVLQGRISKENQAAIRNLVPALEKARAYRGRGGEVVRKAACQLLAAVAASTSWEFKEATSARYLQTLEECARHTTDEIQVAAADALVVLARFRFGPELIARCVETCLTGLQKADETIAARRGFVLSLGALPRDRLGERRQSILSALCKEVRGVELPGGTDQDDPVTRQYAVLSLGRLCVCASVTSSELEEAAQTLEAALRDYAVDRRGDVGSWVREVAMEVATAFLQLPAPADAPAPSAESNPTATNLVALMLQQAVEKIDRLRERAFGLLGQLMCSADAAGNVELEAAERGVELAYSRVCQNQAYDPAATVEAPPGPKRWAWPPAHLADLVKALEQPLVTAPSAPEIVTGPSLRGAAGTELRADRNADIFEKLTPLLLCEAYRPALAKGLIVSMGGLTEHTAKDAKRALLRVLQQGGPVEEVGQELLRIFDAVGTKDQNPEAKRLLAPLLTSVGILLSEGLFPQALGRPLLTRALNAVLVSKDIPRLRCSVQVFVGLLRWPGAVRLQALRALMHLLGHSFPTVRQATAQGLYIWLLEVDGDLDLSQVQADEEAELKDPVPTAAASAAEVAEVQELVSATPWATDNNQLLQQVLHEVHAKLKLSLPTTGFLFLAPKRTKVDRMPKEAVYADLVRENHF